MKIAKLKCFFGLHDYETVTTVKNIMSASFMYVDGDVCKRCEHMKENDRVAAHHMISMCIGKPEGKLIVHPAVLKGIQKEIT